MREEMRHRKSLEERFWAKVDKTSECWIWTGAKRDGTRYGVISSSKGRKMLDAHHVAYELVIGAIPDGSQVLHRCDNPPCVNPAHLFLGTQAENMRDMVQKGRSGIGSRNPKSKLTETDVVAIRLAYAQYGAKVRSRLAATYSISLAHVSDIAHGRYWKHVSGYSK